MVKPAIILERCWFIVSILVAVLLSSATFKAYAQEFIGSSYRVLDPVLFSGTLSTSTDYRLRGVVSQIAVGTSTASDYRLSTGYLYFPFVSIPTVTATAGDGQVSLSWNAATSALGWTVSGYSVGQATVSGGSYTYTSVGNVTSRTATGLSNGTTYYFVVNPEDAFSNRIATSSEVSAAPSAAAPPPPPPTPTGGGITLPFVRPFVEILVPSPLPRPPLPLAPPFCPYRNIADLNCDGRVNLADLSIFLFLSGRALPNIADLNFDRFLNVKDLSYLFYNWTDRLLTFVPEGIVVERGGGIAIVEGPRQEIPTGGAAALGAIVGGQVSEAPSGLVKEPRFRRVVLKMSMAVKSVIELPIKIWRRLSVFMKKKF